MPKLLVVLLLSYIVFISGCANQDTSGKLHLSPQYYNFLQPTFEQYVDVTDQWLRTNRKFLSNDQEKELQLNMPFSQGDKNSDKAILLIHGLGDSPFSFHDIAKVLVKEGFYVEVLLLPGHGSSFEHMQDVEYQDWQNIVNHYVNLLTNKYNDVWLGGFSTGANLASIYYLDNKKDNQLSGLLFFSAAFQSLNPTLEKVFPYFAIFSDGLVHPETNLARYSSLSFNGMAEYVESAELFRQKIKTQTVDIPTLIVMSEHDSIIDSNVIANIYTQHFTHPSNRFIWYGDKVHQQQSFASYPMNLPKFNIRTASHMSALFSQDNFYYGIHGEKKICMNNLSEEDAAYCAAGNPVWFSAWGYEEEGKVFARLTWNPYFADLEKQIIEILDDSDNLAK